MSIILNLKGEDEMKKGLLTVVMGMMILIGLAGSATAAKIAVLDVSKVVKEYDKYKEASVRLEKEVEDKRGKLEQAQKDLAKRQNDLEVQKGIVSEKKYNKLQEKFQEEKASFLDEYRNEQQSIVKKQKTLLENIENDVLEVVKKIAKKEKYEMVLDKNATYYHSGDDITYKVLDKLNK